VENPGFLFGAEKVYEVDEVDNCHSKMERLYFI
jgi:hypothetical protein